MHFLERELAPVPLRQDNGANDYSIPQLRGPGGESSPWQGAGTESLPRALEAETSAGMQNFLTKLLTTPASAHIIGATNR